MTVDTTVEQEEDSLIVLDDDFEDDNMDIDFGALEQIEQQQPPPQLNRFEPEQPRRTEHHQPVSRSPPPTRPKSASSRAVHSGANPYSKSSNPYTTKPQHKANKPVEPVAVCSAVTIVCTDLTQRAPARPPSNQKPTRQEPMTKYTTTKESLSHSPRTSTDPQVHLVSEVQPTLSRSGLVKIKVSSRCCGFLTWCRVLYPSVKLESTVTRLPGKSKVFMGR